VQAGILQLIVLVRAMSNLRLVMAKGIALIKRLLGEQILLASLPVYTASVAPSPEEIVKPQKPTTSSKARAAEGEAKETKGGGVKQRTTYAFCS
jgi:hypothetical protein